MQHREMTEGGVPADLAGALRRMRAEWADEQHQAACDAAEAYRHRRSVADRLCDHAMRGDEVRLRAPGTDVTGTIVAVSDEFVTLDAVGARIEVVTADRALVVAVVRARRGAGRNRPRSAVSLRARLLEREAGGRAVVVGTVHQGVEFTGAIALGADHLVVGSATVALAAVAWLRSGAPA